jgi:hypothetical protein
MEDDGTVNMMKEPTPFLISSSSLSVSGREENTHDVDLDRKTNPSINYGSLKNLLPTKRATWTKLDFKGASVEDERRTKKMVVDAAAATTIRDDSGADMSVNSGEGGRSLQGLLPVRPTWTKLDFHGASVEDERRTKWIAPRSGSVGFNEGKYSNLKTLLPERTITFRKDQVFSSGSATMVNSKNTRRKQSSESQGRVKNEVMSTAAISLGDNVDVEINKDADNNCYSSMHGKAFAKLKDLLPEKKISWRTIK